MRLALLQRAAPILLFLAISASLPAHAGQHGGEGGGGATLSFVTNLASDAGTDRYVNINLVLEAASPEVEQAIKLYLPRIQHQVILLLSGSREAALRTREGKHELAEAIRKAVNEALDEGEKTGVKEVLFTTFLIQ